MDTLKLFVYTPLTKMDKEHDRRHVIIYGTLHMSIVKWLVPTKGSSKFHLTNF